MPRKEYKNLNCKIDKSVSDKLEKLTAIQNDETYKSEGGFVPERNQYYFERG